MVWKILRPHYWMLDRKVRTTNRFVLIGLFLLVWFGGQWAYDNLIRDNLALLDSEQAATTIASALPTGAFVLSLFAMLGVGDVMHQLFLASDLELLMVAPVSHRAIFGVKLLQCSRATLVPALVYGVFLSALGAAQGAALSYYVLIVLLILAAMTLATAAIMMLVILLARLLPAQKVRSWMPLAVVLATFALLLSQGPVAQGLLNQTNLITFLTGALLDPGRLALVVAGLGWLAAATGLAAYRVFETSFNEGWNRFRVAPTRRKATSLAARRPWGVSRLVQLLPAPLRYFLVKEWLELRRDPRGLMALAQPLVLVVVVLAPFLSAGKEAETLRPLVFWFMVAFLMLFLSVLPLGTSLMAVAQEGRNITLLRSLPISMSDVLKGKFWATWTPTTLSWALVFLIAGLWLQFPLGQIGFLVGVAIWGLAGASAATMAMSGLKVDFTAQELKQRASMPTSYLVMGVNLIFGLLTMATFVWLVTRLFADSPVVVAIEALADYGAVGCVFSEKLWVPLALISGQTVFWTWVKVSWDAAVRRLEGWEDI